MISVDSGAQELSLVVWYLAPKVIMVGRYGEVGREWP